MTSSNAAADAGDEVETREVVVDSARHGLRLDKLAVNVAPEFSRSHLQALIAGGRVCIDGTPQRAPARKVRVGERFCVELSPTAECLAFRPEPVELVVVHEDEHLLVIDKPAGLVVHPAAGHWSGTLLNGLLARDPASTRLPRAGIVHRLDKDTSGLMLVGRTLPAVTALSRAIAERAVQRRYMAIAHGSVVPRTFSVDAPIGRDSRSRLRMAVVAGAREARTDVETVARSPTFSALRCRLHTGRTHQIRVHLASRGHPLVGDSLYGGRPALGMTRQALHADRLELSHPVSGDPLRFESTPPADFAAAWRQLLESESARGSRQEIPP